MKLIEAEEVLRLGVKLEQLGRFETRVANGGAKIYTAHCYAAFADETYDFSIPREEVEERIRSEKATIEKRLAELGVEL
jgi:hypothetical protein